MKKVFPVICCLLFLANALLYAEDILKPFYPVSDRIIITERSDFSKYENGRYIGHIYREARVDIAAVSQDKLNTFFEGEAFVFEETLRDMRATAKLVDEVLPVAFELNARGQLRFTRDEAYPILRAMPNSPSDAIKIGEHWTGEGVVVVRPIAEAPATRIPVLAEYEFIGSTMYNGTEAHAIKARYAIRYKGSDRLGDPNMSSANGSRLTDFIIDAKTGSPLFIRESIDETYSYKDLTTVRFKGFILHFYKGASPLDHDRIAEILEPALQKKDASQIEAIKPSDSGDSALTRSTMPFMDDIQNPNHDSADLIAKADSTEKTAATNKLEASISTGPEGKKPFELEKREKGIVLLLFDLRFVADSDELLAAEKGRLDVIAEALKKLPENNFLIEGHAADLGKAKGEMELSRQRAKKIAAELAKRGIDPSHIVYRGLGSTMPIATNSNEEGRARNRRVEITILD